MQMKSRTIISIIILLIITIGCISTTSSEEPMTIVLMKQEKSFGVTFKVFHDNQLNVTCYHMDGIMYGEAGNCISDYDLKGVP